MIFSGLTTNISFFSLPSNTHYRADRRTYILKSGYFLLNRSFVTNPNELTENGCKIYTVLYEKSASIVRGGSPEVKINAIQFFKTNCCCQTGWHLIKVLLLSAVNFVRKFYNFSQSTEKKTSIMEKRDISYSSIFRRFFKSVAVINQKSMLSKFSFNLIKFAC
uniref:Uncharacterized protein n=1 Tax=Onchocerca volvulus TaxID=6282 RepID=A0A8R1TJE9_ONCVO